MRRQLFARIALLISIMLIASVPATQRTLAAIRSAAPAVRATPHPAVQPLMFIANAGQLDAPARFQVHGNGATLFLADDAIWLTIIDSMAQNTTRRQFANPASVASPADDSPPGARPAWARGSNIKISFAGANPRPQLEPFGQLDTRVGFFRGAQSNWRAGLVAWSGVRYRDLYPGIDLEVSGANGQLEQQLRVRPGADLGAVQLRVDGAESQRIDGAYLRLSTKAGEVALPLLLAKADNGQPIVTAATPQIHGRTIAAPFAQAAGLAAAPTPQGTNDLLFSSFIGGEYDDKAWAVASDTSGATYITGETFSPGFPKTPGAFDTSCGTAAAANCDYSGQFYAWDAYVVKINAAGTGLSYATFLGGENDDGGYGIAVDADGAAYVTGYTISTAFPVTNTLTGTPFDDTCGTDSICNFDGSFYYYDGFLAKLSPDGSALVYSSYFGGANGDWGNAIAVNSSNEAYITGRTFAPDFPTTSGAFDETCGTDGACDFANNTYYYDGFALRFTSNGGDLQYSTYLGGNNRETGFDIAVDSNGAAYVTGNTTSDDFPTTSNAYDTECGTDGLCDLLNNFVYYDIFVVKIKPDGSDLAYGTYAGGSNGEGGYSIAVDSNGAAYITGYIYSSLNLSGPNVLDPTLDGLFDSFAIKLNPNGTNVVYGTYIGGSEADSGRGIAVDSSGNAYITGWTTSGDMPISGNAYSLFFGGATDAFALKLSANGSSLLYGTFLGGSEIDESHGLALGPNNSMQLAGLTASANFPITAGAPDASYAGNTCGQNPDSHPCYDAFVARLVPGTIVSSPVVRTFTPLGLLNATLGAGVVPPPPPPACDAFEPNDDRKTNPKKITIGAALQAKLCQNDKEDNYFVELERNSTVNITLDVPLTLKTKTLLYVYSQADNYATPVCANGNRPNTTRITAACGVLGSGRYVVRLYTATAADFDNTNSYSLLLSS
ncbi:MAG: SBBP repeat-containing protein [Kouleothrix sp.]|nr:SBBP repeat-containing protein [Kouleothrix sp.]